MEKEGIVRCWEITKDKERIPEDSTWNVMTIIPELKYQDVGKIYSVRVWVENGFKNSKSELGWADFRVTEYREIQKWWEIVMSVYWVCQEVCVKGRKVIKGTCHQTQ